MAKTVSLPKQLSRTAIEQHIRCPRCFYLQRKLKLTPISTPPLTLANATDTLLKNEFDVVRATGARHALWERESLSVRAYQHPDLDLWRNSFKGIRVTHSSGIDIHGGVDDVWENLDTGDLHIVDYKSTSKQGVPDLEGGWGPQYKRQIEIYQWLFRGAGHRISNVGYFLYVNGRKDGGFYERGTVGVMRFSTTVIAHQGDDRWVADAVDAAVACLRSDVVPQSGDDCDTCRYVGDRQALG
jgi:RecB family exonuclease